ncbi:hypothetical protein BC938DRAFT_480649 [Jimgerdemannia flammicorona]|uniref:Uncharacterized protein n=1 Tax=Jimgerdemannia flammicorona TaxID=994334 RepID=A0A433QI27_9FUNG|nr:hypothetical protein BC938DRAFT_480649 [Jimgerdemannia flammicorona]
MSTAIPEVDLGIDIRSKDIEETEKAKQKINEDREGEGRDVVGRKAKRKMIEDQQKKKDVEQFAGSNYVATDRFYQGRRDQSHHEYRKAANPHAPPGAEGSGSGRGRGQPYDKGNIAPDGIVPERFKRIRR